MRQSLRIYIIAILAISTVLTAGWLMLRPAVEDSGIEAVATDESIVSTQARLDSILSIGQWELMSIEVQADVDTVQTRWFGLKKERLQRRYHGRISLGILLGDDVKVKRNGSSNPSAISQHPTPIIVLPPASVLDSNFIDESKTELIVCESETMEQDPKLKAAMLRKARDMMLRDAATPQRLKECEQKAANEINRILNR